MAQKKQLWLNCSSIINVEIMNTVLFGTSNQSLKFLGNSRVVLSIVFWGVVYGVAILQDYIEAVIESTGFYWSETMLYNTYWLWFIPLIYGAKKLYATIRPKSVLLKISYLTLTSLVFTTIHMLVFTEVFILASELLYANPHRFSRIFENVLSNQIYITLIAYMFAPIFINYLKRDVRNKPTSKADFIELITVKKGSRRIPLKVIDIQSITTNRPYSEISTGENKYLHDDTLKKLESLLDPNIFMRVHRSALVNKEHITELVSRGNGDYDAKLVNGDSIRFSRHYRQHWHFLATTGA